MNKTNPIYSRELKKVTQERDKAVKDLQDIATALKDAGVCLDTVKAIRKEYGNA